MKDDFSEKDISFVFFNKSAADDFEDTLTLVLNGISKIDDDDEGVFGDALLTL